MWCKIKTEQAETILKLINKHIPDDYDLTDKEASAITLLSLTL